MSLDAAAVARIARLARIRVTDDQALAAKFCADFDTIWNRLHPTAPERFLLTVRNADPK